MPLSSRRPSTQHNVPAMTPKPLGELLTVGIQASLWRLKLSTWRYEEHDGKRKEFLAPPVPAVFAFESDLKDGGKTEIERYFAVDSEASVRPTIHMLCVVGRGFWWYKFKHHGTKGAWVFCKATEHHEEVIAFLALLTSMMVGRARERPAPLFEHYLTRLRIPTGKQEN